VSRIKLSEPSHGRILGVSGQNAFLTGEATACAA
jgi:hypothetical protein